MEGKRRGFEPIKINVLGAETGHSRFYHDGFTTAPALANWRVNLTALSQRYNLLFVATCNKIQVFEPDFPYQRLGNKPVLTIAPQLDNPDARGFIEPRNPHNINHLTVGELGSQEILLLSTDSGNVVAYYTNAIDAAIDKNPYQFAADALADFVGLRPFFSQWVKESAWGLAIHSAGRMIAVSANCTHNVRDPDPSAKLTVFAFALTGPGGESEENIHENDNDVIMAEHAEWQEWDPTQQNALLDVPSRDRNYKIILAGRDGHKHNIPSVTFINNSGDENGSWLLSTDIAGRMKMWQIWKGRCCRNWHFPEGNSPWMRNDEAGWLVAALDVQAFWPAESMEKFIGYHRARQHYGHQHSGDSYDITNVVQRYTPQSSRFYPGADMDEEESSDTEDEEHEDILFQAMIEPEGNTLEGLPQAPDLMSEADGPVPSVQRLPSSRISNLPQSWNHETILESSDDESSHSIEIVGDLSDADEDQESDDADEDDNSPNSDQSATTMSSFEHDNTDQQDISQPEISTNNTLETATAPSLAGRAKIQSKGWQQSSHPGNNTKLELPPVPIIQCSTSHVRLFRDPSANTPHIFCARMLRQTLPHDLDRRNFSLLDRLNMFHQIPELGIVLIASQLGRCAVCSLTKRKDDGLLGLRVDWILPTKKQERNNVRPYASALLGIAVGPIQGHAKQEPEAVSEYDNDETWAQDRMIGGTSTTFDPYVVRLRSDLVQADDGLTYAGKPSKSWNVHREVADESPGASAVILEKRPWKKPQLDESWSARENSRTYRLMLTYADLTVLSYEISRTVEREDQRAP